MRTSISAMLAVAVLACIMGLVWRLKPTTDQRFINLQKEQTELRSRIEALDSGLAGSGPPENRVRRLAPSDFEGDPSGAVSKTHQFEGELVARLTDLAVVQSNTLVLLERLSTQIPHMESSEEHLRRRVENLPRLEAAVAENQKVVESLKLRTSELLETLQIPDNISIMHPDVALNTLSLKPYWVFFEAKRDRDREQELADLFRKRLTAERIEAGANLR